ncbi:PAS domain S-box protein [Desulfococcaceae bacterium HSG8]|nr:PAS domain S-box protein [Desulfococcaceae bacterium HSG8]
MKKPVILCVDDEKIVLSSLKEQLKRAFGNKYGIETAESGEDAVYLYEELAEDEIEVPVIISDYIMPGMKGDELLKYLHGLSPGMLKILLTGQASTEGVTNAVNYASLYRYIAKPWEQDDLVLTVTEALRSYSRDQQLKEQTEKLLESEKKYRGIFENALEGIYQSIPEGRYLNVNPAMAHMLGYDTADELIESITDIRNQLYVDPERRDELFRMIQTHEVVTDFEVQYYRKDGSKTWVSLNAHPAFDENGEIILLEGIVEDISHRKQAEEALLRAYEKRKELEHIINRSPVVVFLWKNAPGWPVEFVSENVSQFGYTPEDFISGRVSYSEIIHPDDAARVAQKVERYTLERKPEFTQEYRIITKSGEIRWTDDRTWTRTDDAENITHYQGIVLDVTFRKEKEKAEREREVAEAANKKIMDSIRYAKMIQRSLLPNAEQVKIYLPHSFFLWKPRDIVGGDIFFTDFFKNGFVVAVIDCTGHSVPGAFMTMIASSALRRIVKDECCYDPSEILKRLNLIVKKTLHQDTKHALSDDGMDAAICLVRMTDTYFTSFELTFAGARLPLFYTSDGEVTVVRGDKKSIGYKRSDLDFNFTDHTIPIKKGMNFYMATDGFWDQLGSDESSRFKVRSFGMRRLTNLIGEISDLPFEEQREILLQNFNEYKTGNDIQDDVTVVGFGFRS